MVLQCPVLWSAIEVTPSWCQSFVKLHVTRSSEYPLEIDIHGWKEGENHRRLLAMLDVLVACADHWRSLVIRADVSTSHLSRSLKKIYHRKSYPSLTHVSIKNIPQSLHGTAKLGHFYAGSCPCLENLELGAAFEDSSGFEVPPSLTSLAFGLGDNGPSSILPRLSLQKLTTLSLSGSASGVHIDPRSISLPLLKNFTCKAYKGNVLVQAIVAPKLDYFEYSPPGWDFVLGGDFELTDPHTGYLCLSQLATRCGSEAVHFMFPAARHIDLGDPEVAFLAFPSGVGSINRAPDHWPHLESLTVRGLADDFLQLLDGLVVWLNVRQTMGLPRLLVRFAFWYGHYEDGSIISALYEKLHEITILEWINVPLGPGIVFSGRTDELLRLEIPNVHRMLIDKISKAFIAGHVLITNLER